MLVNRKGKPRSPAPTSPPLLTRILTWPVAEYIPVAALTASNSLVCTAMEDQIKCCSLVLLLDIQEAHCWTFIESSCSAVFSVCKPRTTHTHSHGPTVSDLPCTSGIEMFGSLTLVCSYCLCAEIQDLEGHRNCMDNSEPAGASGKHGRYALRSFAGG